MINCGTFLIHGLLTLFMPLFLMAPDGVVASEHLRVVAVGDIMMGSSYPENLLPENDGAGIFDGVKGAFEAADLVFGNLEGVLLDGGKPVKCENRSSLRCFEFRTPTRYGRYLKNAGFNVLSIANNHLFDFGLDGAKSTIEVLDALGIRTAGGESIARFQVKGKRIVVAGFSFTPSLYAYPLLDVAEAVRIVGELKKTADILIVSFHGGAEGRYAVHVSDKEEVFLGEHRGNVVRFSKSLIDGGADLIIGHGPHVLRALELYRGKLIVYSLGNFLTYGRFNIRGPNGLSVILRAKMNMENGDFLEGELIPLRLANGGIPEIDAEKEALAFLRKLCKEDVVGSGLMISEDGLLTRATERRAGEARK
jgi:hypothetical protein